MRTRSPTLSSADAEQRVRQPLGRRWRGVPTRSSPPAEPSSVALPRAPAAAARCGTSSSTVAVIDRAAFAAGDDAGIRERADR